MIYLEFENPQFLSQKDQNTII